jgi:hypothetical protein
MGRYAIAESGRFPTGRYANAIAESGRFPTGRYANAIAYSGHFAISYAGCFAIAWWAFHHHQIFSLSDHKPIIPSKSAFWRQNPHLDR